VRVAEQLPHHDPAARLDDPAQLAQRGALVGDLAEHGDEVGRVERAVGVRQRARVGERGEDVVDVLLVGALHGVVEHLLLHVEHVEAAVRHEPARHRQRVVAGARPDLEQALAGLRLEDLAQPRPRDERVRRLDPEALRVGAGGRVLAPPERRAGHGRRTSGGEPADHDSPAAGTIRRICRRASISTGVSQSRPEPSSDTSWQSIIVKNSWSRRFT
jgi:hypothetical protein